MQLDTTRYDTIRCDTRCYFNVRSKADMSQVTIKWRRGGDFQKTAEDISLSTFLIISYVNSYRDIDSYVTMLPSLLTALYKCPL